MFSYVAINQFEQNPGATRQPQITNLPGLSLILIIDAPAHHLFKPNRLRQIPDGADQ